MRGLLLTTYVVRLELVAVAAGDDVRINCLLLWWRPSWILHLGFLNSHFSIAKQCIVNKRYLRNDYMCWSS